MRVFPVLAIMAILYSSCVTTVENCTSPELSGFQLNATDTIRDDSVTIYRYAYGSNFAQHTHSFERRVSSGGLSALVNMEGFVSPSKADWKLVLHPSENVYYIKGILFTTKTVRGSRFSATCTEKITYTVNDILLEHIPQNPSLTPGPVILPVPY